MAAFGAKRTFGALWHAADKAAAVVVLDHQQPDADVAAARAGQVPRHLVQLNVAVGTFSSDCSLKDGIVLDAFAGSGSTLVAAENTGRRGYALEIDPHYVDTVVRRMAGVTSESAVLAATGETFAEVAKAREAAPILAEA